MRNNPNKQQEKNQEQELKPTKNIQEQKRKSKKVTKKQENKINT